LLGSPYLCGVLRPNHVHETMNLVPQNKHLYLRDFTGLSPPNLLILVSSKWSSLWACIWAVPQHKVYRKPHGCAATVGQIWRIKRPLERIHHSRSPLSSSLGLHAFLSPPVPVSWAGCINLAPGRHRFNVYCKRCRRQELHITMAKELGW